MDETWRTVENFTDYAVSNIGRVKRVVDRHYSKAGRILKQYKRSNNCEYLSVTLCNTVIKKMFNVHRLIIEAFKGKSKLVCNHIDGNKFNNCIDNLEWVTQDENMKHAKRIGLRDMCGEKHPMVKLNNDKVLIIRHMFPMYTYRELADMFNVYRSTIEKVINRKTWRHI